MNRLILFVLVFVSYHITFAQFPAEFSWTNVHGKNWITSTKDQRFQGPCNTFTAIALTEARYNLEYNSSFGKDLSEFHIYSAPCTGIAAEFIVLEDALDALESRGAVNETCLPFPNISTPNCGSQDVSAGWLPDASQNESCDFPCSGPQYKIKIDGYTDGLSAFSSNDAIKELLINHGPIAVNFNGESSFHNGSTHAYLLTGWEDDCPDIKWEFKDSWPGVSSGCESNPHSGPRIYKQALDFPALKASFKLNDAYYIAKSDGIDYFTYNYSPQGWNLSNPTVSCATDFDKDNDGYYFWGFGPRPSCVSSTAKVDLDDNDSTSGYIANDGTVAGSTAPDNCPTVNYTAINVVGGFSTLCPSEYYNFYITVPGATMYSWSLEGQAHFTSGTTWQNVSIYTHSNFGRVSFTVDVFVPCCGWYTTSRTWYYGWGCSGGGWWLAENENENQIPFNVYPNPLDRAEVNIRLPEDIGEIEEINVRSLDGRLIYRNQSISDTYLQIPIQEVANGVYTVNVISKQGKTSKKLVIQR